MINLEENEADGKGFQWMRKIDLEIKKFGFTFRWLDVIKSIGMLAAATGVGNIFWEVGLSEANITMVYILAVLIISMITTHQIYSMIFSVVSVVVFNYFFTVPRFTLHAYDKDYPITFVIMFLAAFLTGSLAERLKKLALENEKNVREKAEAAMLVEKEQLRANLLRAMSHDLRTPLTSISGNASNLLVNETCFDEGTRRQLYLDIYDDSMWLINLVENLLSISKMEEGRLHLHFTTELLDEVISEALSHVNRKKEEHQIRINSCEDFLLVKIDAHLIMQVLINILDNAIKYTQKNSVITITTEKRGNMAVVVIADNGPGVAEEEKEFVFDMFYSGTKNLADSHRSLGLGLALCKSIINTHGGEIWLEDNVPTGAVFVFSLPTEEVNLHE